MNEMIPPYVKADVSWQDEIEVLRDATKGSGCWIDSYP